MKGSGGAVASTGELDARVRSPREIVGYYCYVHIHLLLIFRSCPLLPVTGEVSRFSRYVALVKLPRERALRRTPLWGLCRAG